MVTRARLLPLLLAVLVISFAARSAPASAAADELDPSFGTGGVATIELNDVTAPLYGIALQDDGKIVVSGRDGSNGLAVARLNTDGTLDPSFAGDGVFTSDLVSRGRDVVIADDGKILVSSSGDLYLQRLNSNGTSDTTFMGNGATGSQFFNPDDPGETQEPDMASVIPWPGGGAIVGGTVDYGPYFFTFARHNNDGAIDMTFGDDGQVQTDFSPSGDHRDQEPLALAPYRDGFVAGGYRDMGDDVNTEASVIAVYDADGQLDDSFGDDGKTTSDFFPDSDQIEEVLPLDDDRIVAVGDGDRIVNFASEDVPFIARYDPDGTLNSTFGDNGVIIFDDMPGSWDVTSAALAEDGSIIIAGDHEDGNHRMFFARFDSEGNPDPDFGEDGWLVLDIPGDTNSVVNDIVIDENGDIIGAGHVTVGVPKAAVVKLGGTPAPQHLWGDVDCDGEITTRDNQAELRFVLQQNALSQTEPCPDIGTAAIVDGVARTWGDEDCDTEVSTRDNQSKLRFVLQQNPLSQTEPCPDVGAPVVVSDA